LQAFDCLSFDSGLRYLRVDTSIDCDSNAYKDFSTVIVMFVIIYQCIPLLWFVLLYRKKSDLNPPTSNHDEKLALFIRNQHPELASIRFLFVDYKCSKWWFEIFDMYRRIIFIGVLPLVSTHTAVKASFGCVLGVLSGIYFREINPYRIEETNIIARLAQVRLYRLLPNQSVVSFSDTTLLLSRSFGFMTLSLSRFWFHDSILISLLVS